MWKGGGIYCRRYTSSYGAACGCLIVGVVSDLSLSGSEQRGSVAYLAETARVGEVGGSGSSEVEPGFVDGERQVNQQHSIARLFAQIYRLKPLDRQIIMLYLEGESAAGIAEVLGLSVERQTRCARGPGGMKQNDCGCFGEWSY
jgi:hypothetical protein